MPSDPGAEHIIHSLICEIKRKDEPIVIDFELPKTLGFGKHKVVTFESYVTRADLKETLRHRVVLSGVALHYAILRWRQAARCGMILCPDCFAHARATFSGSRLW